MQEAPNTNMAAAGSKAALAAALETGALVALAALVLYVWQTPREILGGDNPEFSTLAAVGGVAHPSGYPLYVLWMRAMTWLPAATPAQAAARATAILGAAQVLVLIAACRAWGASALASAFAVALYAGGPLPLLLHTEAEVFALLGLVAATLLWLSAPRAPLVGVPRLAALGLCAGLGLSNHVSCALLAPLGLWAAVRGIRESKRKALAVVVGVSGLAIGLLPYLTLLHPPAGGLLWGKVDSAHALIDHVFRREYGLFKLSAKGDGSSVAGRSAAFANLAFLGKDLLRGWLGVPLAIAVWWMAHILFGKPKPERGAWALWLVSFLLCGPVFIAAFNLAPQGLSIFVVARFHLLPLLLLALPVAAGLTLLLSRVPQRWARLRDGAEVAAALPILGLCVSAALSLPALERAHSPAVERFLVNTLRALPPHAALIGMGDHQVFGFAYLQRTRGLRPDVVYVDWALMGNPWYVEQTAARLGFPPVPPAGPDVLPGKASVRLARTLMAHGYAVCVDSVALRYIVDALPSYPLGTVLRVLPDGGRPPPPEQVLRENTALFDSFDLSYPRPALTDGWSGFVQARYSATWAMLAQAFNRMGRRAEVPQLAKRAAALAPLP